MSCNCNKPKRHCGVIPVRTCCPNPTAVNRNEFLEYKNDIKNQLTEVDAQLKDKTIEIKDLQLKDAELESGKQNKLVAGNNITLTENSDKTTTIAAIGSAGAYTAGDGINITNNEVSVNNTVQRTLTAGANITIDANNVISSTGGGSTYSAGDGIAIANDEISVNNTIQRTLTAGTNITIDANNEISADAPVVTLQTTDPGEGQTLEANHFIGVYNA